MIYFTVGIHGTKFPAYVLFVVFRIKDLEELQYLYPDVPKDDAFGKFYSKIDGNNKYMLYKVG